MPNYEMSAGAVLATEEPPPLPHRQVHATSTFGGTSHVPEALYYGENFEVLENGENLNMTDQFYELPNNNNDNSDSECDLDHIDQEFSNIIRKENFKITRVLYAKVILLSLLFGLAGGILGGRLVETTSQQNSAAETNVGWGASPPQYCTCTKGTILFAYTSINEDPCFAVADGNTTHNGVLLPNLLQKNGLFIRAGTGEQVGNVEESSVNLNNVSAVAKSSVTFHNNQFSENGNGNETGFYLSQTAMFGITGSERGNQVNPTAQTNVTLSSGATETAPVSIRLLPLVCIAEY